MLESARRAGIEIAANCGGRGTCGKCRVRISGDIGPPSEEEKKVLSDDELLNGVRLACLTVVSSDLEVEVLGETLDSAVRQSAMEYVQGEGFAADYRSAGAHAKCSLGVALDIGTTTLAARLFDLCSGKCLSSATAMNPQRLYGSDVAARISFIIENATGLDVLGGLVRNSVQRIIEYMAAESDVSIGDISRVMVVANPTMMNIFLGVDPRWIATAPFAMPNSGSLVMAAGELGLELSDECGVYILPASAAYVGADALAAAVRVKLMKSGRPAVLADLGTNAEIILTDGNNIYSCAAAAGPALEGAHIKNGITATDGAIDRVEFNGGLNVGTIKGAPATGLCGTGLLDAIAMLLDTGLIDSSGRMAQAQSHGQPDALARRMKGEGASREFVISESGETATGSDICLSQKDVREVQLAKGAIATGIEVLMESAGVHGGDLERIYLAGALGTFIKPGTVLRIGMVPGVDSEKIVFAGNAALDGCAEVMLYNECLDDIMEIADSAEYIELSAVEGFSERFAANMHFSPAQVKNRDKADNSRNSK